MKVATGKIKGKRLERLWKNKEQVQRREKGERIDGKGGGAGREKSLK